LGFSSEVAGIINLCGAIGDSSWINAGEPRMLSMHGDNDVIVPYGSAPVVVFNANLPVDGSASMNIRMQHEGVENPFYTFAGAGHTPFLAGFSSRASQYMDTVMNYSSEILHGWICEHYSAATPVDPLLSAGGEIQVYPNPAVDQVRIEWEKNLFVEARIMVYDLQGQKIQVEVQETTNGFLLHRGSLPPGYYVILLEDEKHETMYRRNVLLR
jgi:hypothetical protein